MVADPCPSEPCVWQCGYEGELREKSWEWCQEANVCAATIDWAEVRNEAERLQ